MFSYYLRLAWASMRRTPVLSGLMVLALGLGIGAFMTTFTVYYLMSGDPIPHKSDRLFYVQVDAWDPERPWDDDDPNEPPNQLTYRDMMAAITSDIWARSPLASFIGEAVDANGCSATQLDTDGDGKVSKEEAPEPMRGRFDSMDTNGDGFIDRSEHEAGTGGHAVDSCHHRLFHPADLQYRQVKLGSQGVKSGPRSCRISKGPLEITTGTKSLAFACDDNPPHIRFSGKSGQLVC